MPGAIFVEPEWLTHTFDLGQVQGLTVAGVGQVNPLGVLRLETSKGRYAIKQMDREPKRLALRIESIAFESGFPMSEPILTRTAQRYAVLPHQHRPIWVRAYRWVDGTPYAWGHVSTGASTEVGRLLALLHALPVPMGELRDDVPWSALGSDGWAELASRGLQLGLPWGPVLRDRVATLTSLEAHILHHFVTDEPMVPSQRDLHPPNVIRGPEGRHRLVDWDAAGPVNAREEVATFALVWATPPGESPRADAVQAFIHGYRGAGGRFETRGIADFTHQLSSRLNWVRYNLERDLELRPDAQPGLTLALLSGVQSLDLNALTQTAALFQV